MAASAAARRGPRVLLRGTRGNGATEAAFAACAVDALGCGVASVPCVLEPGRRFDTVHCSMAFDGGAGALTLGCHGAEPALPLAHAQACPARAQQRRMGGDPAAAAAESYTIVSEERRRVHVGVAVLALAEPDGAVLLTRRARHLRIFPGAWVAPGGHVEDGESMEAAAAREIGEEAGIHVEADRLAPLCLWESTYPDDSAVRPRLPPARGANAPFTHQAPHTCARSARCAPTTSWSTLWPASPPLPPTSRPAPASRAWRLIV